MSQLCVFVCVCDSYSIFWAIHSPCYEMTFIQSYRLVCGMLYNKIFHSTVASIASQLTDKHLAETIHIIPDLSATLFTEYIVIFQLPSISFLKWRKIIIMYSRGPITLLVPQLLPFSMEMEPEQV